MTRQVLVLWREEISSALPDLAPSQHAYIDPEGAHLLTLVLPRLTELGPVKLRSKSS